MDPAVITVCVDAPKANTTETLAVGNSGERENVARIKEESNQMEMTD